MKAYVIAAIGGQESDASAAYRARLPDLVERHSGRFLIRGIDRARDAEPSRLLAIEFPTLSKARAFADDPDGRAMAALLSPDALSLQVFSEEADASGHEGLRPEQLTSDNHD